MTILLTALTVLLTLWVIATVWVVWPRRAEKPLPQAPTVSEIHARRLREWDADYQRLMDETGETERIRREQTAQIARDYEARLREIRDCGCGGGIHAVKTWGQETPIRVIHDCKRDAT